MNAKNQFDASEASVSVREQLLARQGDLLAQIEAAGKEVLSATVQDSTEVTDLKEQANRHERDLVHDAETQRDRDELIAVRAALARLDEGSFGICVDCGQEINAQRLAAMPSAARCVECQSRAETHARMP